MSTAGSALRLAAFVAARIPVPSAIAFTPPAVASLGRSVAVFVRTMGTAFINYRWRCIGYRNCINPRVSEVPDNILKTIAAFQLNP